MSSRESGYTTDFVPGPFDAKEVDDFIKTGYSGAEKMRNVGKKRISAHTPLGRPITGETGYISGLTGESLDSLVKAFFDWKENVDKTKKQHEEYVKLSQDRPGRQATILAPMSGPESKAILGANITPGKSVLG